MIQMQLNLDTETQERTWNSFHYGVWRLRVESQTNFLGLASLLRKVESYVPLWDDTCIFLIDLRIYVHVWESFAYNATKFLCYAILQHESENNSKIGPIYDMEFNNSVL